MKPKTVVVDYGIGNLYSVARALETVNSEVIISSNPNIIKNAERLVLPGVGSFSKGMSELKSRVIDEALHEFILTSRPLLGICLGMQLMFDSSEEFGVHKGLGIIPGQVLAIPSEGHHGVRRKIPHIGWTQLILPQSRKNWTGSIFEDVVHGESAYFVHSYSVFPIEESIRLVECNYDGYLIAAAVQFNQIIGCQFHPEKSGKVGLKILHNFLVI